MSCHPKYCKRPLLALIMKQDQDMLVKILFLQDLPPEVRLKFSGYSGTTQQLMNEADSKKSSINIQCPSHHTSQVCLTMNSVIPTKLSVLHAILSGEEPGTNRKLRSAAKSRQAHSDSEESRSKVNQCDGNEHSRQQQWRYGQNVSHCFAEPVVFNLEVATSVGVVCLFLASF